jgi:hypothetical protein
MLLATRTGVLSGWSGDLALGLGCAILVSAFACRSSTNSLYGRISAGISDISYTLYLVHFPLMAFVFFVFFHGKQIAPTAVTALWFGALFGLTIAYSVIIWWLFERNTDKVRIFVETKIAKLRKANLTPEVEWIPVGITLWMRLLGVARWSTFFTTAFSSLSEWWIQWIHRKGLSFAHSSLYPILFMILVYRIIPEGIGPTARTHPERIQQEVLMHRTSSRIIAAIDAS